MPSLRHLYYDLKPFLPVALRLAFRRRLASGIRRQSGSIWPIKHDTIQKPAHWHGWPDGKQFALVLTHDVESAAGVERVPRLAELERELGFRSSFNFIPEGGYETPAELRAHLSSNGFEVGVHDLHHNGKLYRSESDFRDAAAKINGYLEKWQAVGFRSGFMHHNLKWLHALNIKYDLSTFDTDPFEPQPDGVDTIYPFWVPAPPASVSSSQSAPGSSQVEPQCPPSLRGESSSGLSPMANRQSPIESSPPAAHRPLPTAFRPGYVEMPYTLPQDSTLFLILRERCLKIWKEKLDWIARQGGMALLNVHPDYMSFDATGLTRSHYPAAFYRQFLEYILERYADTCWRPLPREAADYFIPNRAPTS